jgi:ketosteroid isomerase-like protein
MRKQMLAIFRAVICVLVLFFVFSLSVTRSSSVSGNEQTIWELEHSYWRYVQENNFPAYLNLWHKDFLGWPSVNQAPVRKDHITDWITSQTGKGLSFKFVEFKPAAIQITGNLAVVCYWVRSAWVDKDGAGTEATLRITHTWIKTGNDWQIVGGMSMPEPSNPHK